MALADNDNDQAKSKRTQNSGLGYNSLNHSVQNTSKFGDDPPHSPNFKGDNIFKESPIDKFEKHEHISEVPTLDNLDNKSSNGEKQSKIDELK